MKIKSFTPLIAVYGTSFLITITLIKNFNSYLYAHMRGTFLTEEEAENRSLELGCEGIHKNQNKWMPCKNEKELHIYLRK